ncbi:acyltransferase family protein [Aliikangiella coralliicola]|uniref:Acyltransferase family protein n=1 Tax=Aliikangiella coralliicola TaxID=2592383 RepID=A0A545UBU3_9GAMM|nr:acyltransferase family protein [Aliikangiella coralliicola]TQV86934.1 acyltransferase family protein [Aliikangiella coralliicola]
MNHTMTGDDITHLEKTDINQSIRYHYMDNLRALAMLTGIFFHAALAYSPIMDNLWLSADKENSLILDVIAWFTHMFRMPLFFVIAGFFAFLLIEKRGLREFLKNRGKRILAPFLLFLPLVLIAIMGTIFWAATNVENPSPFLQFFVAISNNPDIPKPPFSTTHLWFLFNLCLFCLTIAFLMRFRLLNGLFNGKFLTPKFIVFIMPLLLVPALYSQVTPHPAPERIYPELWSFGFYGMFFLLGCAFYQKKELMDELKKYWMWMFFASLVGYGYFYYELPGTITFEDIMKAANGIEHSWKHLLIVTIEAYVGVYLSICSLIVGRLFLDKENKIVRFVADSSYWVYIVHLPLLFFIQYLLLDVSWNIWVKFFVGSFGTLAIGLVSYILLVRWTPIGWLLNGRK